MASIPLPTPPRSVLLRFVLLCLLTAGLNAQAQISQKLETETAHLGADLERAVVKLQPMVERYGYAGVAGAVAVEGFGIPAPGQTMLMAAALEAARGHLHITLLTALAALAAVAGNSLGYLIGRIGGRPLLRKLRVSESHEEKLAGLFERYGGGFIVLARFLDGARQLNGIVAGILGMRWWIFTAFNVLGALLWVGVWGMGTYYLSEHVQTVDALIQKVNPWFSGFVVLAAVGMILYLLRGRSASTRG